MSEKVLLINLFDNSPYEFSQHGKYFVRQIDSSKMPYQILKPIKDQVIDEGFKYCTFKIGNKLYQSVRTNSLSWLKLNTLKRARFIKWRAIHKYTQISIFDL